MTKITYILHSTDIYSGATKAFLTLLEGLKGMEYEHIVVLPDENGVYSTLQQMGVKTYVLNYRMALYPPLREWRDWLMFVPRLIGRIMLNRKAAKQLAQILKLEKVTLVHSNSSVVDIGYRACQAIGVPHVWHIREYADTQTHFIYYPCRKLYRKHFTASENYTLCITKGVQAHHGLVGIDSSFVVYDGVVSKKPIITGEQKGSYFLYAGRLEALKGIEDLVLAYGKYIQQMAGRKDAVAPLYIAGDTNDKEYKSHIMSLVQDLHITEYVRFGGFRNDILELMRRERAIIIPSRSEGFGFVMAEAQSQGTLVIGKNESGLKEQFDNGVECSGQEIGLRYSNEEELVARLVEVSTTKIENYQSMVEAAQKVVSQLYTKEQYVQHILSIYPTIIYRK